MPDTPSSASAEATAARPWLPLMLLLFVGSGCAALIYEIVWLQMLQLVIGSTAVSLGVLLATFMGGMCAGSLLLPRMLSARHRPLRVYAVLELGIGAIGMAILYAVPLLEQVYLSATGHGMAGILLRGVVSAVCLFPPTFLMGATLPMMARGLETSKEGVSWLGFFYGGNLAGAVFGCLFAGFYLLRVYDMHTATYVAAFFNVCVAVVAIGLDGQMPWTPPTAESSASPPKSAPGATLTYVAIGLSGLSALGAEVVWTRLMSLLLGGTVYAFSNILAVFLIGLGIGSSIGSWAARLAANPRVALGCCQMALTLAIAWSAYMIANSLPYWPIDPTIAQSPWYTFQLDLVRCLWAILPAAILWGASFPLALAAAAAPGQDPGRLVGGVYAANTVGAILGSLLFSLVMIPQFGTQDSQRGLIAVAMAAALLMLLPALARLKADARPARACALFVVTAFALGLMAKVSKIPDGLVEYGRALAAKKSEFGAPETLYLGEGINSSVAVTKESSGYLNFHVSGKVEASTEPQDMRLQRMLGHIPALLEGDPRSVLIVGCGAGVTAGTFLTYPSIERIVVCEIEPLIPQFVTPYFSPENYGLMDDVAQKNPRTINGKQVMVIYDDGRHFLHTTKEKFDIITSDPIHPWVKGSAALYTQEYFELCRDHLNPGGMVTQWVPLYESTFDTVKSELKTFFTVFPDATIWSNDNSGAGYDMVMLGGTPEKIDLNAMQSLLDSPPFAAVDDSLQQVGFTSALDLFMTYGGRASDLEPWLADADINHDRDLRLQYLAGFGSNLYLEGQIYSEMKRYRVYPDGLFIGSSFSLHRLTDAIGPRHEEK